MKALNNQKKMEIQVNISLPLNFTICTKIPSGKFLYITYKESDGVYRVYKNGIESAPISADRAGKEYYLALELLRKYGNKVIFGISIK